MELTVSCGARSRLQQRLLAALFSGVIAVGLATPTNAAQFFFRGTDSVIERNRGESGGGEVSPPGPRSQLTVTAPQNIQIRRYESVAQGSKPRVQNALAPVTFSISPELPQGLVLNKDGSVTGQALAALTTTTYTISATDGIGGDLGNASSTFTVSVDPRVELAVEGATEAEFLILSGQKSVRFNPASLATVYGSAEWSVDGPVPSWMRISRDGNDLVISGIPDRADTAGTTIGIKLSDRFDVSSMHLVKVTVVRPADAAVAMPVSVQSSMRFLDKYSQDLAALSTIKGYAPEELTWEAKADQQGDALLPGITLEKNGLLHGQALAVGPYAFTVKVLAGTELVASRHYAFNVQSESVARVTATDQSSCLLTADGDIKCWGSNNSGRLGNGGTVSSSVPVAASRLTGKYRDISGGYSGFVCAIRVDDTVWCWGRGSSGQLGNGVAVTSPNAVQVSGLTDVRAISSGYSHACAVRNNGSMWCWGLGIAVGYGSTTNVSVPTAVKGMDSGVVSIASGNGYSCASKNDGSVWCWGQNGNGRLGDGTTVSRLEPVAVKNIRDVISLTAGYDHTCATKVDKTVMCWGFSVLGQLGNGPTSGDFPTPQEVLGLTDTYFLTTGDHHSCAIKTDRTVMCWGSNSNGQIGNGTTVDANVPVTVEGMTGVSSITTTGYHHSCAVKMDGSVWCWGENNWGQIGDGTGNQTTRPVRVSGT
ncbi:hypothetical protein G6L37_03290 [Agrobacterium rubi]|nr:hypothetical protein [Agrobacterium rubi]NTF24400.1 hypothetical protein [Agrobacterium rubi]